MIIRHSTTIRRRKRRALEVTRDKCYGLGATSSAGESSLGGSSTPQTQTTTTTTTTPTKTAAAAPLTTTTTLTSPIMQRNNSSKRRSRSSSTCLERSTKLLLPILLLTTWLTCTRSMAHSHQHHHPHHRRYHLSRLNSDLVGGGGFSRRLANTNAGADFSVRIPGLYERSTLITPVQGGSSFDRVVLGEPSEPIDNATLPLLRPNETYVNLVQFYMATCPDCQGFAPYFKRLASDIGGHWRNLVRLVVFNCNDDLNIPYCWKENPVLLVPMVRWYAFPDLQFDARQPKHLFEFPSYLLNVNHRSDFIEGQRRDLIALRHATLRYMNLILDQISCKNETVNKLEEGQESPQSNCNSANAQLYTILPVRWRLLDEIGARRSSRNGVTAFVEELEFRTRRCLDEANRREEEVSSVKNYIVFETADSFAGRTLAADWSNWTCAPHLPSPAANKKLLLVHYTRDLELLNQLIMDSDESSEDVTELKSLQPLLFSFNVNLNSQADGHEPKVDIDKLRFRLISSKGSLSGDDVSPVMNKTGSALRKFRQKRRVDEETSPKLARRSQRLTLEQFSTRRRSLDSMNRLSIRYAASMTTTDRRRQPARVRRFASAPKARKLRLEDLHLNWAPEELYPQVETLRYTFNKKVAEFVFGSNYTGAFAGFASGNQGELELPKRNVSKVVSPLEEDTTHVRLTDYYLSLAEIVHKTMHQKAELDGYQYLSNTCFLRTLSLYFPFQGTGTDKEHKSKSRHFLELLQQKQTAELESNVDNLSATCRSKPNLSEETRAALRKFRVSPTHLESLQSELHKKHNIGIPLAGHFGWSYCAGSNEYLRGYTCSLWVLFHTLTVHEYLKIQGDTSVRQSDENRIKSSSGSSAAASDDPQPIEYKFTIRYSPNNTHCDPKNPDSALQSSTTEELFVPATHLALGTIINFVRFFLPCSNCAAHFSCMVHNSQIDFQEPQPDDHLLWLWEGHNLVNLRTKNTHSEDPRHPKHVFPVYEACPECYLEKPAEKSSFTDMRFNRRQLVNFLVARYRRSSILNNKIRIEELFGKPVN